jgi:hypothetical protein
MILKLGQKVDFTIKLKVVKAFAHEDNLYYIVGVVKKGTPIDHMTQPLWGVLNVDMSCESIPPEVMERARNIVPTLKLDNLE